MLFNHDGISLWYGTADAPGPDSTIKSGREISITVGVQPVDASNNVEVLYRINGGPTKSVAAQWWQTDSYRQAQYFRARLPVFRTGDTVEYTPMCRCAGRQVPSLEEAKKFSSSFYVVDGEVKSYAVLTPKGPPLPRPQLSIRPQGVINASGPALTSRQWPGDDGGPPHDGDIGDGGPPTPPTLPYPDIVLEMLACLDNPNLPLTRNNLKEGMIKNLKDAEKVLNQQNVSLFPNLEFRGGCFNSLEKDGIWGRGFPGAVNDWQRILQPLEFLFGRARSLFPVGVVITTTLINKAAKIADDYLAGLLFSKGIVLARLDVALEGTNRVKTTLHGGIRDVVFPFDLWPPRWTITLVETLSIEQTPVDCVPKKLLIHSDLSADIDIPLVERLFIDLGVFPIFGFLPVAGIPLFVPGEPEFLLGMAPDLIKAELIGRKIPGIGAELSLTLPSQVLIPNSCEKVVFDYQSVDVESTKPEGIRVVATICPPIRRQPKVSIKGWHSFHIGISRLLRMGGAPFVGGKYELTGIEDLRGDPDTELRIFWQATQGTVTPIGKPSVEITFNLYRDRDHFQVGQHLAKYIDVAVYDLDNCLAQASLSVTITIYDDTQPPEPAEPPKPIPPLG